MMLVLPLLVFILIPTCIYGVKSSEVITSKDLDNNDRKVFLQREDRVRNDLELCELDKTIKKSLLCRSREVRSGLEATSGGELPDEVKVITAAASAGAKIGGEAGAKAGIKSAQKSPPTVGTVKPDGAAETDFVNKSITGMQVGVMQGVNFAPVVDEQQEDSVSNASSSVEAVDGTTASTASQLPLHPLVPHSQAAQGSNQTLDTANVQSSEWQETGTDEPLAIKSYHLKSGPHDVSAGTGDNSNVHFAPEEIQDPDLSGQADSANAIAEAGLKAHNILRKIHGVPPMALDRAMTKSAEAYARKLAKSGVMQHSSATERDDEGENLAMGCSTRGPGMTVERATKKWYEEVCKYGYDFTNPGGSSGTGHFTQVVWKNSTTLGIGTATGRDGLMTCTYVVGRYKKSGNMAGRYKENVLKGGFQESICRQLDEVLQGVNQAQSPSQSKANATGGSTTAENGGAGKFALQGLRAHNMFRKIHQAPPMKLDEQMTKSAEAYAKKIAKLGKLEHSQASERDSHGENLAYACSSGDKEMTAEEATKKWYAEVCKRQYDFSSSVGSPGTGHFTQVVWKGSTYLGMGKATSMVEGMKCTFIVGRYKEAGNMQGKYKENVALGQFNAKNVCSKLDEMISNIASQSLRPSNREENFTFAEDFNSEDIPAQLEGKETFVQDDEQHGVSLPVDSNRSQESAGDGLAKKLGVDMQKILNLAKKAGEEAGVKAVAKERAEDIANAEDQLIKNLSNVASRAGAEAGKEAGERAGKEVANEINNKSKSLSTRKPQVSFNEAARGLRGSHHANGFRGRKKNDVVRGMKQAKHSLTVSRQYTSERSSEHSGAAGVRQNEVTPSAGTTGKLAVAGAIAGAKAGAAAAAEAAALAVKEARKTGATEPTGNNNSLGNNKQGNPGDALTGADNSAAKAAAEGDKAEKIKEAGEKGAKKGAEAGRLAGEAAGEKVLSDSGGKFNDAVRNAAKAAGAKAGAVSGAMAGAKAAVQGVGGSEDDAKKAEDRAKQVGEVASGNDGPNNGSINASGGSTTNQGAGSEAEGKGSGTPQPNVKEGTAETGAGGGSQRNPDKVDQASKQDSRKFEEEALKAHNRFRQTHSAPDLKLSDEMNAAAAAYAKTIAHKGTLEHAANIDDGENLAMQCNTEGKSKTSGEFFTTMWYKEVCEPGYDFNSPSFGRKTGHFTQVVWKDSKELGIGTAIGKSGSWDCTFVVARYRPAGNYQNKFKENVAQGSFDKSVCGKL